jgi:hypothetical protein
MAGKKVGGAKSIYFYMLGTGQVSGGSQAPHERTFFMTTFARMPRTFFKILLLAR